MKQRKTTPLELAENAIAIASGFYNSDVLFGRFYAKHAVRLNGFPGIWTWLANAALIFSAEAGKQDWVEHQWIDATGKYAAALLLRKRLPTEKQLASLARRAINAS